MTKVLVTGSEGFIGSAVCEELKERGVSVDRFDLTLGDDVREPEALTERTAGFDAIIHLAGLLGTHELFYNPREAVDINVGGTVEALKAAEAHGLHYVSIEQLRTWKNVYSVTRAASRDLGTAWHAHRGVRTSYVRAYNVHGPRQFLNPPHPQKMMPTFSDRAWRELSIPVFGTGNAIVDMTEVSDVARVFADVTLGQPGDNATYDAGTGVTLTVLDVAQHVAEYVSKKTGREVEIEHVPMRLGEKEDQRVVAAEGLGWDRLPARPRFSWEQIEATVDWYREPRP